jgi:uncharacterized damage-inducible protein DinB
VCLPRLFQTDKQLLLKGDLMKLFSRAFVFLSLISLNPLAFSQRSLNVSQAIDFWISNAEKDVVSAADAMPEEKFSFAPVAGRYTGARTFAQQIKHLAANNYRMAAYIFTHTPTADQEAETGPEAVRTKAEIMDYVRGSFAALHGAVASINEQNEVQPLNRTGRQNTRLQLAIDAVAHSYDHYGQMVEYLRMNGVVPPASKN